MTSKHWLDRSYIAFNSDSQHKYNLNWSNTKLEKAYRPRYTKASVSNPGIILAKSLVLETLPIKSEKTNGPKIALTNTTKIVTTITEIDHHLYFFTSCQK